MSNDVYDPYNGYPIGNTSNTNSNQNSQTINIPVSNSNPIFSNGSSFSGTPSNINYTNLSTSGLHVSDSFYVTITSRKFSGNFNTLCKNVTKVTYDLKSKKLTLTVNDQLTKEFDTTLLFLLKETIDFISIHYEKNFYVKRVIKFKNLDCISHNTDLERKSSKYTEVDLSFEFDGFEISS